MTVRRTEAIRDASLLKMRPALIIAVKNRDTAAVLEYSTFKAMLSFGGDIARATLRKILTSQKGY